MVTIGTIQVEKFVPNDPHASNCFENILKSFLSSK